MNATPFCEQINLNNPGEGPLLEKSSCPTVEHGALVKYTTMGTLPVRSIEPGGMNEIHFDHKVVVQVALFLEGSFGRMKVLEPEFTETFDLILKCLFQVVVRTPHFLHDERSLIVCVA
jgi:hypothetical protein